MNKAVAFLALAMLVSSGAFAVNYSLNVTVIPTGSGYVQLDPSGGSYVAGTPVTLTPIPLAGYVFSHWSTDLTGTVAPALLMMNSDKNVTAVFASEECALETVAIRSPRNGSTIKVGRESSDLPIIFSVAVNCVTDVEQVTFMLNDGWEAVALVSEQNGLYSVTGPSITNLGYGAHTLYVAAASKDQPGTVFEDIVTFTVEAAPAGDDSDINGLPDDCFATLDTAGASWISSVIVPETLNRRLTIATRWEGLVQGEVDAGPIVLSLKNPARPAQMVNVSVPRSLLKEDESGILIVQIAPDLVTLLGSIEAQMIAAEPSILVEGGQFVEVCVISSTDYGATYGEVESGRFDDAPVHLTMKGLDVSAGSTYLIYSHESGFEHHPTFGDRVVGWQDEWKTNGLRELLITDGAMGVDATSLSIFAPYRAPLTGPRIGLSPSSGSSRDYGYVEIGEYRDLTFTLRNTGGGVLSGRATTTNDAFGAVANGVYNLDPGEAVRVTVRFTPTAVDSYIGNLIFDGAGYATIYLSGRGTKTGFVLECTSSAPSKGTEEAGGPSGDILLVALSALALLLASGAAFRRQGRVQD